MILQSEKIPDLTHWLSKKLGPICDADSGTLAQYVIALLKHEREDEALKLHCVEQLTDFLKNKTEPFVRDLFDVIKDESYIRSPRARTEDADESDEDKSERRIGFERRRSNEDDDDDRWQRDDGDRRSRRFSSFAHNSDEDDNGRKKSRLAESSSRASVSTTQRAPSDRNRERDNRERDTRALNAPIDHRRDVDRNGRSKGSNPGSNRDRDRDRDFNSRSGGGGGYPTGGAGGGPTSSGFSGRMGESRGMQPPHFPMMGAPYGIGMHMGMGAMMNMNQEAMRRMYMMGYAPQFPHGGMGANGGPGGPGGSGMNTGLGGPGQGMRPHGGQRSEDILSRDTSPRFPPGHDHAEPGPPIVRPNPPPGPMPQVGGIPPHGIPGGLGVGVGAGAPPAMTAMPLGLVEGSPAVDAWTPPVPMGPAPLTHLGGQMGTGVGGTDVVSAGVTIGPGGFDGKVVVVNPRDVTPVGMNDGGIAGGGGSSNLNPSAPPYEPQYSHFDQWGIPHIQTAGHAESISRGGNYGGVGIGIGGAGDSAYLYHHPGRPHRQEIPEEERCTLKCTGIPQYVTEIELMNHFRTFGRITQLQLTRPGSLHPGDAPDKKAFNECLVQFYNHQDAKKCYGSPAAVLNNRFIKMFHSPFNLIAVSEVPPPTVEEEQEQERFMQQQHQKQKHQSQQQQQYQPHHHHQQQQLDATSDAQFSQRRLDPRAAAASRRQPLAGAVRFKNQKYVAQAGVAPPSVTPTSAAGGDVGEGGGLITETEGDGVGNPDGNAGEGGVDPDGVHMAVEAIAGGADDSGRGRPQDEQEGGDRDKEAVQGQEEEGGPSSSAVTSLKHEVGEMFGDDIVGSAAASRYPHRQKVPTRPAAPTKADLALQQKYEELRKAREQAESILKKKETLLQAQIDQYRLMITKLEASADSDDNRDRIEGFEGKIVDLQSQLRVVTEQREKGIISAPSPSHQHGYGAPPPWATGGRQSGGRYGGRSAAGGRFAGRAGRLAGHTGGRSYSGRQPNANLVFDNRPRSLVVAQPPSNFLDSAEMHFGRFGEIRSINNLDDGNVAIEFGSRKEAEIAKSQGAMYEGNALVLDWHHDNVA